MQNSATKFLLYKNDTSNLAWGNYTKQNHLYYNGLIQPAELAQKPLQFVSTTKSLSRGITPLLDLTNPFVYQLKKSILK